MIPTRPQFERQIIPQTKGETMAHGGHPSERKDPRSNLVKRQTAEDTMAVEVCPFGCEKADMDGFGYCRHLIGFTNAQLAEGPVKDAKGGEVELLTVEENSKRKVVSGKRAPLQRGDILIRITSSRRVYRDVDAAKTAQTANKPKEPEKVPIG
jgi:hypothetical protein